MQKQIVGNQQFEPCPYSGLMPDWDMVEDTRTPEERNGYIRATNSASLLYSNGKDADGIERLHQQNVGTRTKVWAWQHACLP
jgi:hypothetical protein